MILNIWNTLKLWFLNHTSHNWVENHLLYFSLVWLVIIIILGIIILTKFNKDIKNINKEIRNSFKTYMWKTSKHNKDKDRKQLKF